MSKHGRPFLQYPRSPVLTLHESSSRDASRNRAVVARPECDRSARVRQHETRLTARWHSAHNPFATTIKNSARRGKAVKLLPVVLTGTEGHPLAAR